MEDNSRRAKNNLVEAFANQQKAGGVAVKPEEQHPAFAANTVPDIRAIEDYVTPIIERVSKGANKKKQQAEPEVERESEVERKHLGEYDLGRPGEVRAHEGAYIPTPRDCVHYVVRKIRTVPEWRKKFDDARLLCKFHPMHPDSSCGDCRRREEKNNSILRDFFRIYGNPARPRDPKIIIT